MDAGSPDGPGPRPDDAAAQPVAVLEELLAAKGEHLLRTAVLLAGTDKQGAGTLTIDFRWLAPTSALQGTDRADPERVPRAQRVRVTTHSTWWVIGNASNARSPSTCQPPAISRPR